MRFNELSENAKFLAVDKYGDDAEVCELKRWSGLTFTELAIREGWQFNEQGEKIIN